MTGRSSEFARMIIERIKQEAVKFPEFQSPKILPELLGGEVESNPSESENARVEFDCASDSGDRPSVVAYGYYELIRVELPPAPVSFTMQVDPSRIEGVIASCKRRITAASGVPHQLLNGESEVASCEQIDRRRLRLSQPPIIFPNAIGNINCINNAHSPHLRCAINPCGPCEGCSHFES